MKSGVLMLLILPLSACYEETDLTLHRPGVYLGKSDLHKMDAKERETVLAQRFHQVQTDR